MSSNAQTQLHAPSLCAPRCMMQSISGARLGAPTAINAGAHKLARLFYRMLKFGAAYVEQGQAYSGLYQAAFVKRCCGKSPGFG